MKVALIYPPSCDPTAPYLSVPTLAGYLRAHGVDVVSIDANVEAWDALLSREPLEQLARRVEDRLAALDAKPSLGHLDQLVYTQLWRARGDADAAPRAVDQAKDVLRGDGFYDPERYAAAIATVDAAQRLVAAAHAPMSLDFTAYRTPFSLLTADEIAADPTPFHDWFAGPLTDRLRAEKVDVVGISLAFPGQIQPGYALAHVLRRTLPGVHLTVGGPAITQTLIRLQGERLARAIGPFDSAVVFEGEQALLELARSVARGDAPRGVIRGQQVEDMGLLPCPDFDGLPLDKYLSPELILPYDPTRGCYWGVCTFCHYGLAEVGTARYRERPVETSMAHLRHLAKRHGVDKFYFSQDSVSPRTIVKLARAIRDEKLPWRWGTDMRPERSLTPEKCQELAEGGALNMALGVESAAPRVLSLIDKGIPVETVRTAMRNLAGVGVAVEAMCFTDFPTETKREALATLDLLHDAHPDLALFICGEFDLTHGALVAQKPGDFGIRETWQLEGDELGTGLFYEERRASKSEADQARLDEALGELSARWWVRRYPWAGAVSTAHTMLWYARFGPDVFKDLADAPEPAVPGARVQRATARFDVAAVARAVGEREAEIWHRLVRVERRVSRARWLELAAEAPAARPRAGTWRYTTGGRLERAGRRPSHAPNAARSG